MNDKKLREKTVPASAEAVASQPDLRQCRKCGMTSALALLSPRLVTIPPGVEQVSVYCPSCGTLLARTIDGERIAVGLGCKPGTPDDEIPATAKAPDPRLRADAVTDPDALRAKHMVDLEERLAKAEAKLAAKLPETAPPGG